MKLFTIKTGLALLLIFGINYSNAQGIWNKMASFPGVTRDQGANFSIGQYGFIGGGWNGSSGYYKDFYKWSQVTNTWSSITAYPGAGSVAQIAFAINGYGYVGMGQSSSGVSNDLWRYDTGKNTWTSMASFPGTSRYASDVFVIGHKAYLVGGSTGGPPYLTDVWVYDANANTWKQLNSAPTGDIEQLVAFSIGNHGYICGGYNNPSFITGCWEYDTANDSWAAIASLPVPVSGEAFVIGSKAYIPEGENSNGTLKDGYAFDTVTKAWTTFSNLGANGIERRWSVAFTVGNYGYIGTGYDSLGNLENDYWQWTPGTPPPVCNTWTKMANFAGANRDQGANFSIGNFGFIGGGWDGSSNYFKDFYKWNQTTNTWSTIANYPGVGSVAQIAFAINGYGYVGMGESGSGVSNDLWRYDTGKNTWTAMATFPGPSRYASDVFVIGHKAYVIGGSAGGPPYYTDVWMYDANANTWKQLNNTPTNDVEQLVAFSIGNHGYVCGGYNNPSFLTGCWEYDTTNDSWTTIANLPEPVSGEAFVIGSKAYIPEGENSNGTLKDGYSYDTATKAWTSFTNLGANGIERRWSVAFSIGNYGYIGTGSDSLGNDLNDYWQWVPCNTSCSLDANFTYVIGSGGQVTFTNASKGTVANTSYNWSAGDGTGHGTNKGFTYTYTANGTYLVNLRISDSTGTCVSDTSASITISNTPDLCNNWKKMSAFSGVTRDQGASFSIGQYGFIGGGWNGGSSYYKDFYKWNQLTNNWSAIANYPGVGSVAQIAFAINGYGYVGMGDGSGGVSNDLWRYDTGKNAWTSMAVFPGSSRYASDVFVIGHKAYVIGGSSGGPPYFNDVWVYDANANTWKQLNNAPMGDVEQLVAFSIGNHGYVCGGYNNPTFLTGSWEYDTTNDSWTSIASLPVPVSGQAFVIGSKAYIPEGENSNGTLQDGYAYDTATKAWTSFSNLGASGIERRWSVALTIGNSGYIGTGYDSLGNLVNDYWQWTPCSKCAGMQPGFTYTLGTGGQVVFTNTSTGVTAATTYSWSAGDGMGRGNASSYAYTYMYNGTYAVNLIIGDSAGTCSSDTAIYVTITNATSCNLHANFTIANGASGLVNFTNTSTGITKGTQYYWNAGDGIGSGNTSAFNYNYAYNGTYGVNLYIADSLGICSSDTTIYIAVTSAGVCNLSADFTYNLGSSGEVTFTSTSTGMNASTQLYWYAGDSIGYGYGNPYSYTYAKNGTYPVNLFLYNVNSGCMSDTTINITITSANNSSNTCTLGMLLVSSKASCDTCDNGSAIVVASSGTAPYSYHWSNGSTASTIVAKPGIYTCCVTDAKGCSACSSTTVSDSCLYAEYTYSISYDTLGGVDSATVTFVSISDTVCADSSLYKNAQKNPKISYTWNFGDGNSQTISGIGVRTSKHTFVPGTYDITLAINREGSPTKSVTTNPIHVKKSGALTGITSISENMGVKLFPNPNNGSFRLTINGVSGNQDAQLEVTNLLGEIIYTTNANSSNGMIQHDINLVNASAGTYFVRVITPGKVYNSKVAITK